MSYIGFYEINNTPTFTITTRRVDTGAASDADTNPMYHVYEDETSTPIITGTMSLLNSANTAGFYSEQITLSAANGFEVGKSYNIYIQATVNGVTGSMSRSFQIRPNVIGVNVLQWGSGTVPNPNITGVPKVDLTHINGLATSGNNATLNLKQLNISNSDNYGSAAVFQGGLGGDAVRAIGGDAILGESGAGRGAVISGGIDNGTGEGGGIGLGVYGGDGEPAGHFLGGVSGGHGLYLQGDGGKSLQAPQGILANIVGNITGTFVGNIYGNVTGSVLRVIEPVGISTGTFMSAMADAIWDELLSGHLIPGSAGHTLFSRMPTGTVLVGDKTGFYLATPQTFDLIGNISGTMTNVINVLNPVGINTGTFIGAIADGVWDEQISGHLSAGSTGEKLNSAGGAGDPWSTNVPGAYTPGQAGYVLASRMPTGTVIVGTNNDKTGYSLVTGTIVPANVKQINDTNLTGNGSSTPWGPA